jgi:hypothetical protein
MCISSNKTEQINKLRVIFSVAYFLIFVLLLVIFRKNIFYFEVPKESLNLYRLIWCISFTSLGFSLVAFEYRYHKPSPFPKYVIHYPFQLLAMAALIFSVLHIFEATSGYLFYYLSASLCFTLGYMVDRYWGFIESAVGKVSKS